MSNFLRTVFILLLLCVLITPVSAQQYPYREENPPDSMSTYVLLTDIDNGQVLISENGEERMYPASLTKVLSALVSADALQDPDETVLITPEMWAGLLEADASVAGFQPGETPTVTDLLYGLLLPSGADAANALAFRVSGSVPAFVEAMNAKAAEIGMTGSHFTNPTGLHDPDHYSTPADLALLMNRALQNELLRNILNTRSYTATTGLAMTSTSWPLINNGEGTVEIPGFLGGKTGFTNPAGRCLLSHAEFNGMHLVLVTGGATGTGHIEDAGVIYRWAEESYTRTTAASASSLLAEREILDAEKKTILSVSVPEDVVMDLPKTAVIEVSCDIPEELTAPIQEGDVIGFMQITADGQLIYESDLYSGITARYSSFAHARRMVRMFRTNHPVLFWTIIGTVIVIILFCIRIAQVQHRRKLRRKRRRRKQQRAAMQKRSAR